jgi:glutamine---fructose-6-phosphate transaminase (isomerizing)
MSLMISEANEAHLRVQELLLKDGDTYSALGERLRELKPSVVATIARGSSDHAATYAAYLIPQATGCLVASVPLSLITILKTSIVAKNQLALAISQSGTSKDTNLVFSQLQSAGALGVAIANNENSTLAKSADFFLPQRAGNEVSIAATKTVLCTLASVARLAAVWSQKPDFADCLLELPERLAVAAKRGLEIDERLLRTTSHIYVISRGLGLGMAFEFALKLKEVCGIHAEAFSTAEVRHGPREIVDKSFLVIAIPIAGSGGDDVMSAALELKSQGARVLVVNTDGIFDLAQTGLQAMQSKADFGVSASSQIDARIAPIVILQMIYTWIARCSKDLGRDPDHPRVLTEKVISTV